MAIVPERLRASIASATADVITLRTAVARAAAVYATAADLAARTFPPEQAYDLLCNRFLVDSGADALGDELAALEGLIGEVLGR